ncbi:MAG: DNA topoisomerase IV subunit A [Candidatus Latescibacteria bacterium]|nr:DNA topoisomerase IV subunit A [Candidatus Latescibacterota bacterium]
MAYADSLYEKYYLEYASYSIKHRAIPAIDDGLKPVQRRILHTLFELDDGKFHKVANVVGQTMRYHPHGDQSIYGALVILANKDLFIDKQGNFGSILTGDEASAARYIECRVTPLAREVLYNPEITEFVDSYDGRNQEPVSYPAKVPVVLAMGTEGIASGMTTRILPHNFIELMEAQISCLREEPFEVLPDFPTGGTVDVTEYDEGRGKVLVRAKLDTSDPKSIVVRDLPYGLTTESLITSIEDAARKNRLKIADISDYTAESVEIEIRLARGVHSDDTVDALYAFTDCETSISTNLLVIMDGHPRIMSVSEVIKHNTEQMVKVLEAELELEAGHLRDRLHAKTLEQVFIENRIYKEIEEVKEIKLLNSVVLKGFEPYQSVIKADVTDDDIDTLLKIPIRRISRYDINRAEKEMREIRSRLRKIRDHLNDLTSYAIDFLDGLIEKYRDAYPRRTEIRSFKQVDIRDAAQRNLSLRYDKDTGYIGYGISGGNVLFTVSPYDRVLVIRKSGAYGLHDTLERLFVDKGMHYCGFVEPDLLFTVVYRDDKGYACIKRCKLDKFILNRGYELVPEGCRILALSTEPNLQVQASYKPKPRSRVLEETFNVDDYAVRGSRAKGIRLAAREIKSIKMGIRPADTTPQTESSDTPDSDDS